MNRAHRVAAAIALVSSIQVHAAITLYSSRAAFDAAAPGLPVDRFVNGVGYQSYPLNYYFHTRPVSAATVDGLFPAGCILPGVTITTQSPVFESQAIKVEPVAGGNQIGAATFEDTLILEFSPPVAAVGFDLSGHVYTYPLFNSHAEVAAYSGATRLSFNDIPVSGSTFVGMTSNTSNISRVTLMFVYDEDACTFIANLGFGGAPVVIQDPSDAAACGNGSATFTVGASGPGLSYQWRHDQQAIAGARSATLVLQSVRPVDAGSYDCVVSNFGGTVTSGSAELTVCAADFNCDGQVDFFDYLDFVAAFASLDSGADINADSAIDFFDYLDFVDLYGHGC